jgi:peptide-methionine (S)-S-oxide reductase
MTEKIIFGGGCFWCTEAVFEQLRGIVVVTSGYAGGNVANPTYEQVSTGTTGHAEVIQIEYRPDEISLRDLLAVFFSSHDPTTPDQQGADIGPQYRSIILCTTDEQRTEAERYIAELNDSSKQGTPIVTAVQPLQAFYKAEEKHQQFYQRNQSQGYAQAVINPKLEKVRTEFKRLIKTHL